MPRPKVNRESFEELNARYRRYEQHYSAMRTNMREWQKYIDLQFEVSHPDDVEPVIPPSAKMRIEAAAVELITDKPKIRRRRAGHGPQQQAYDDKIEAALQALLQDVEEYLRTPVLHEGGKTQLSRGAVVLAGPFYDITTGRVWFDAYDPMDCYPEPGPEPREGFIVLRVSVAEMMQMAERFRRLAKFDPRDRDDTTMITLIQWYGYQPGQKFGRYAAWIEDESDFLAAPGPNGYPYLPLDIVYTGWGRRTPGSKPEDMAISILAGTEDLLTNEAELFTIMTAAASNAVWNRYRLPPNVEGAEDFTISTLPNSVSVDVPRELEPFPTENLPATVPEQFGLVQSLLDEALFPRILAGQRQPGVGTATGLQLLTSRARRRFNPPIRLLQAGVSRVLLKVGLLLHALTELMGGDQVFIWRGNVLADRFYGDDYSVEVQLMAEDDEERRLKVAQGIALEDKLPKRTVWQEYFGIENFTDELEQKLFEDLVFSEDFLQSILNEYGIQVQAQNAQKTAEANQNQPTGDNPMADLVSIFRQARTGFVPPQMGTMEGMDQNIRQTQRMAVPAVRGPQFMMPGVR